MVYLVVNMEDSRNKNPEPEPEEDEFIEVFTVPLSDLWDECKRLEGEGYAIDARVGTLAEGIQLCKKFSLV